MLVLALPGPLETHNGSGSFQGFVLAGYAGTASKRTPYRPHVRCTSGADAEHGHHEGYSRVLHRLREVNGVKTLVDADSASPEPMPSLLKTTVKQFLADPHALLEECFGPVSILVEYDDVSSLRAAMETMPGNLTATLHGEEDETTLVRTLLDRLRDRSGRVIWNGWPTGVAVAWAMHHGGPYPATPSPGRTSVGASAIDRFLRPVSYQDVPQRLLPEVLRDANPDRIPRRVDGRLTRSDVTASGTAAVIEL